MDAFKTVGLHITISYTLVLFTTSQLSIFPHPLPVKTSASAKFLLATFIFPVFCCSRVPHSVCPFLDFWPSRAHSHKESTENSSSCMGENTQHLSYQAWVTSHSRAAFRFHPSTYKSQIAIFFTASKCSFLLLSIAFHGSILLSRCVCATSACL